MFGPLKFCPLFGSSDRTEQITDRNPSGVNPARWAIAKTPVRKKEGAPYRIVIGLGWIWCPYRSENDGVLFIADTCSVENFSRYIMPKDAMIGIPVTLYLNSIVSPEFIVTMLVFLARTRDILYEIISLLLFFTISWLCWTVT